MTAVPEEIEDALTNFGSALGDLDALLQPLINADLASVQANLDPADRAKLMLAMVYASNSLFWSMSIPLGIFFFSSREEFLCVCSRSNAPGACVAGSMRGGTCWRLARRI